MFLISCTFRMGDMLFTVAPGQVRECPGYVINCFCTFDFCTTTLSGRNPLSLLAIIFVYSKNFPTLLSFCKLSTAEETTAYLF